MRITLVTNCHPAKRMGGAQYQTWLLAKGLMELGHSVSFVAADTEEETYYVDNAGVPAYEIPNWQIVGTKRHQELIDKVIDKTEPSVVYVRYFFDISPVSKVCRAYQVPFVSMSCHVMETSPLFLGQHALAILGLLRSKKAQLHLKSFYAIKDSAIHGCILNGLQTRVEKWYPRKRIETVYNGLPVPEAETKLRAPSRQVIWVNNIKPWKQPEVYIELARRLPNYRFLMIGRSPSGSYLTDFEKSLSEASSNLDYLGPKPIEETNKLIGESDLLLYTSLPVEGFGNSFVQAWFRNVPTVSYQYEMDGIIEREDVGHCADSFEELVQVVDDLMRDDAGRQEMGVRARRFAERQFSVGRMVGDYADLFTEIAS